MWAVLYINRFCIQMRGVKIKNSTDLRILPDQASVVGKNSARAVQPPQEGTEDGTAPCHRRSRSFGQRRIWAGAVIRSARARTRTVTDLRACPACDRPTGGRARRRGRGPCFGGFSIRNICCRAVTGRFAARKHSARGTCTGAGAYRGTVGAQASMAPCTGDTSLRVS